MRCFGNCRETRTLQGTEVQEHYQEQLTQTLLVCLLKTHLFLLNQILGWTRSPLNNPPALDIVTIPAGGTGSKPGDSGFISPACNSSAGGQGNAALSTTSESERMGSAASSVSNDQHHQLVTTQVSLLLNPSVSKQFTYPLHGS